MYDNTRRANAVQNPAILNQASGPAQEEGPSQIGFVEEANPAVREKMCEMGNLCLEGACPPWI